MKLKTILCEHKFTKMPKELARRKNFLLFITIATTAIMDILSFAIKGAQLALAANMTTLALLLLIVYFIREVIDSSIQTFYDTQQNIFNMQSDDYITKNVSLISNTVRGKVFRKEKNFLEVMTHPEVILHLKEYISLVWSFWKKLPTTISDTLLAVIMSISILITEFMQTGDSRLTLSISMILVICIILFIIVYIFRDKILEKFRETFRLLRKENHILFNDIENTEPLIKEEFLYRLNLFTSNMKKQRKLERKRDIKLNSLYILRTLVLSLFMVLIIIIKFHYIGGFENFNLSVLTDILALSTVYSSILNKVSRILNSFEYIRNIVQDAERVKTDVDNIMEVYETESSVKFEAPSEISNVTVNEFHFSYPGPTTTYTLKNTTSFELERGKSYLVYGHTGCGKSTFMHLIIGKICMNNSPISYGDTCEKAYLSSIMHESNGKIGSNPILDEIIFSDDISTLNHERLFKILHGTHIYEDISRNLGLTCNDDSKVLEHLKNTKIDQYSSGQKQRLSIVKVLYNLNSSHQIVVFDEATNALDDATAISVLKFMSDFCQKDMKRIVLFVSHQVRLTKEFTDGSITFAPKTYPVFEVCPEF